jgi:hypothetical protein
LGFPVRTFLTCFVPFTRANECGVRKTLCQTQPIYCSINPPRNYAAWEAAAAEPMVVTNVPGAAPQSRLRPTPFRHPQRPMKQRLKPSRSWTPSSRGCACGNRHAAAALPFEFFGAHEPVPGPVKFNKSPKQTAPLGRLRASGRNPPPRRRSEPLVGQSFACRLTAFRSWAQSSPLRSSQK